MYKGIAPRLGIVSVVALCGLLMESSWYSYASADLFQGNFGLLINNEISSSLPSSPLPSSPISSSSGALRGLPISNNQGISGSGSGSIACSDGTRVEGGSISFVAFKSNVPLHGSWEVVSIRTSGASQNTGGSFQTGHIGTDQYTLTGRQISDSICRGNPSIPATISGQCGQGVTIELNADNGEKGIFTGDVTCS
ncbi:MAG TPA: hypothetical protein VK553_10100 [Candidatus Nitrosopolaris rasttigaisensis]|jgi:hypothetical protein|nr:hypothetical protein [Candidatus Nitrosopolaris rasttigaisensis]